MEVRALAAGEHRLLVDGASHGPIPAVPDALPPGGLPLGGLVCQEIFAASPRARTALRTHVEAGTGDPPWEHMPELLRDGLVNEDCGLTARGRRALAGARSAA